MYKFKFADIGEGLHEGTVGEIHKKVGDMVNEGDTLFEVETDKMASEIPSPVTGKVVKVLIKQGETVHVGDDVFHFETEGGSVEEAAPAKEEKKEAEEAPAEAASVVGEVKVSNELLDNSFAKADASAEAKVRVGKTSDTVKNNDGVLTTPLARALASEKGIDISQVKGTGHNGRVLVKDIESFTPGASASATVKRDIVPGGETKVKVTPVRKAIAGAMKNSWAQVAYTNLTLEVDLTSIFTQRKAITTTQMIEKLGTKITFLPFIIKATAMALNDFPMLNAKYDELNNEIVQYHDKNIGVAVDAPHGLFVPVVKNAEQKTLVDISKEIVELAGKVRSKSIKPQEMSKGTFSVTNYGSAGAMFGVPVINFPEIAILGTGTIFDKVVLDNGQLTNRKCMHITCAADHRWVDGADVGRFLSRIKQILENPILFIGELNV